VRLELRLEPSGLREVSPQSDADGRLDAAEVAAARDELGAYLLAHYRLFADRGFARPLAGVLARLEPGHPRAGLGPDGEPWVDCELHFACAEPLAQLGVEVTLFLATSPDHRDFATVRWEGERGGAFVFSGLHPRHVFRPGVAPPPGNGPGPELRRAARRAARAAPPGRGRLVLRRAARAVLVRAPRRLAVTRRGAAGQSARRRGTVATCHGQPSSETKCERSPRAGT